MWYEQRCPSTMLLRCVPLRRSEAAVSTRAMMDPRQSEPQMRRMPQCYCATLSYRQVTEKQLTLALADWCLCSVAVGQQDPACSLWRLTVKEWTQDGIAAGEWWVNYKRIGRIQSKRRRGRMRMQMQSAAGRHKVSQRTEGGGEKRRRSLVELYV